MNQPFPNDLVPLHTPHVADLSEMTLSRRGILRAGGVTLGLAALLAACADEASDSKPARVGDAPAPEPLDEPVFSDGVLFRTATSLHYSIIESHNLSKALGDLTPDQVAIVDTFIEGHKKSIGTLQELTARAGSAPFTCSNPRFNRVVLSVLKDRITGRPKRGNEEADVAASDNPNRDALALAFAMESVGQATHQSYVPQLSQPEFRAAAMIESVACARRAAALALAINPENTINAALVEVVGASEPAEPANQETTTTQNIAQTGDEDAGGTGNVQPAAITSPQTYYAVPSQFGTLSAFQLAVGAPSSGNQFTMNIETPSINSFVYDFTTCAETQPVTG